MFSMMNNIGFGSGYIFIYGLHILSVIVFVFGAALLLFWAFKHFTEKTLWRWGWILVVVGTIACLFTFPFWPSFAGGGFGGTGYGMMPMMWGGTWQNFSGVTSTKEEADGKALYEKLQSGKTKCQDVSDSDFELMGEYFMGQRLGAGHEQMNAAMQQMMGTTGEEQMHIIMGQRLSGCTTGAPSSYQFPQGMMRGFGNGTSSQ